MERPNTYHCAMNASFYCRLEYIMEGRVKMVAKRFITPDGQHMRQEEYYHLYCEKTMNLKSNGTGPETICF